MGCAASTPGAKLCAHCNAPHPKLFTATPEKVRELLSDPLMDVEHLYFGNTALTLAAVNGHTDAAVQLIKAKAKLDVKYQLDGAQPLICAARNGNLELVQALLDAGADKEAVDKKGHTALAAAAMNGKAAVVKALADAGANKEAPCTGRAVLSKSNESLSALETASLGDGTKFGFTPLLSAAASMPYVEVMKVLLEAGANPKATITIPTQQGGMIGKVVDKEYSAKELVMRLPSAYTKPVALFESLPPYEDLKPEIKVLIETYGL